MYLSILNPTPGLMLSLILQWLSNSKPSEIFSGAVCSYAVWSPDNYSLAGNFIIFDIDGYSKRYIEYGKWLLW